MVSWITSSYLADYTINFFSLVLYFWSCSERKVHITTMLGGIRNIVSPESSMDLSVLEKMKWVQQQQQQQQQQIHMIQDNDSAEIFSMLNVNSGRELKRLETYLGNNNLLSFGNFNEFAGYYDVGPIEGCISRTNSCQTEAMEVSVVIKEEAERAALNKRKSEVEAGEEEGREKKIKREVEASESIMKMKGNDKTRSGEMSSDTSNENSKVSEIQKQDYIHVRARRGQATDRHSLAERARREKISKKMKYLQELVPGCNKITGKAGMLDEIINYVQSLQRQVEFLSMKLAVMNPAIESQTLQPSSAWDVQMESLYNVFNLGFEDLNRA